MSTEIKIPDIGGAEGVDVIEVMVNVGDVIAKDDSLVTLESDKASMEIPATEAGTVEKVVVKVGDKVSEGDVILIIAAIDGQQDESKVEEQAASEASEPSAPETVESSSNDSQVTVQQIVIPDIGDAKDVDVIEVMVSVGDEVGKDDSLITLEGDKATMEIPSPYSGTIQAISVNVGDKVSQGDLILTLESADGVKTEVSKTKEQSPPPAPSKAEPAKHPPKTQPVVFDDAKANAGPAVRRFARELGVNLAEVKGSGRKGRIVKEDVQAFVKQRMSQAQGGTGIGLPAAPKIDFSKFGEIEHKPLNKIKRITAVNMQRSWLTVPHVTQFDEADVTELEAFRKAQKGSAEKQGYKLTALAFVTKGVAKALMQFPQFNSSLDESGEQLILKKYVNIGIAVDTPNGLVVPVIKECDRKTVVEIAREMGELSLKAREKGLMPADMSGGCFTISSLGGIGGTAFTPIVNHPEVAILGLSRNQMKPIYQNGEFVPRLMLPLSLSYDHRVIDGAEAARFTAYLASVLSDIRTLLL